ncbi:MAG: aminopeptidase P family protein [Saprospiraceae bacterium]
MFAKETYTQRRNTLKEKVGSGLILLMGNDYSPMNYEDNIYHFRQDSTFLYYLGIDVAHVAAIIDVDENKTILFGKDLSVEYIVWMGVQPTMRELADKSGVEECQNYNNISTFLKDAKSKGREIHFLPPYRAENMLKMEEWLDTRVKDLKNNTSKKLIQSVVEQRSIKSAEEIVQMEHAVAITKEMHVAAMRAAKKGRKEYDLAGIAHGIAKGCGGDLAYPIIMTVNGQTLHNHYHGNTLKNGQLVLGDFGAENGMHYAGDITRTFPVAKTFTQKQKEIYQIVLDAEEAAIQALKPNASYKTIHLQAAKDMAEGLKSLGLMKGNIEEAVTEGAHALFFPHGLGHMIGLDVHDMEDLGENLVGYGEGVERSTQFGLKSLRLGKELEEGNVLTVEPGIYFIPELIDQWKAENKFTDFLNYDKINTYRDFGGVRIEDNCLVTKDGHQVLGPRIPKTIEEVEAERNR